jgi:hypothetical protein
MTGGGPVVVRLGGTRELEPGRGDVGERNGFSCGPAAAPVRLQRLGEQRDRLGRVSRAQDTVARLFSSTASAATQPASRAWFRLSVKCPAAAS